MKIKVFQINDELDKNNVIFRSYENTCNIIGGVDPNIYKTIFDGIVEAETLEDVFVMCNNDHPVGYNGHSMSVSDIIQLEDGSCYFCDSVGFKYLDRFDSSKVEPIVGHRMLVIEPHKEPYEMVIPDGLSPLQQAVSGYIEATYPFDDNAFIIGNEEAKLIGLEGNRRIGDSIYAGTILIVADDGHGGTTDLTDDQIEKYSNMFKIPDDITPEDVQGDLWFRVIGFN